jgi:hypothetical protein
LPDLWQGFYASYTKAFKTKFMAPNNIKRIDKSGPRVQHQHNNAWEVMKPFVHFGVKAIATIAHTLISIIKHIPKPDRHKPSGRNGSKVIKI